MENIEELGGTEHKESIKYLTDPELKELPPHLKYVLFGQISLQQAIISNSLSILEEEKLLSVLRGNKEALSWIVTKLKGISPAYRLHKIKLWEEFKLIVQPQQRLNHTMKEVVRKEMLKLLKACMIYLIYDSSWGESSACSSNDGRYDHRPKLK